MNCVSIKHTYVLIYVEIMFIYNALERRKSNVIFLADVNIVIVDFVFE